MTSQGPEHTPAPFLIYLLFVGCSLTCKDWFNVQVCFTSLLSIHHLSLTQHLVVIHPLGRSIQNPRRSLRLTHASHPVNRAKCTRQHSQQPYDQRAEGDGIQRES